MSTQPNPSGSRALPRRSRIPVLIPVGVGACMVMMLIWSAWPLLRPARTIQIEQALVALTTHELSEQTAQSQSLPSASQSTRLVQAAGWLEAHPYSVAASALTDGVIEDILVLEGDRVQQGQPLARLVDQDAELRVARANADHASAQAAQILAQARLTAAKRNWENPYELERAVASTQARIEGLNAQLEQLPSLIRTEQALLVKSTEEHKRIETAYRRNATSEVEYIAARENMNAQASRLEATQARERIIRASISEAQADLNSSRRALELRIDDQERIGVARAQVELAESEVQRSLAVLNEARLELERMTIYAPMSGYVQRRHKAPGDKVMLAMDDPHSAHIVHIYDPAKLQVRVDVPLADASQVFKGQRCEIVVEVLPDRVFEGEVLIVMHEADLQKNTLQIKVRVIDPDPVLRPEMLTRVKFIPESAPTPKAARASTAVRVPVGVLDSREGTDRVWIVTQRNNGQGVLRPIEVSQVVLEDGWVTVNGDLHPGALIAADPASCTAGERVRYSTKNGGSI